MSHKFICFLLPFLMGAVTVFAQDNVGDSAPDHTGKVFISLQGGPALNIYENAFSYRDNGRSADLITVQGGMGIGFYFSEAFGLRFQLGVGTDAGAANTRDTAGGGFYPYQFKHANFFVDAVLNLRGFGNRSTAFRPMLYAGIGGASTFGFTEANHPWQVIKKKNVVPGFRAGFVAEYTFDSGFGLFADFCGEAYSDMYNGLQPSKEDQERYEGYGGFPWDLRGIVSLGMLFYF